MKPLEIHIDIIELLKVASHSTDSLERRELYDAAVAEITQLRKKLEECNKNKAHSLW